MDGELLRWRPKSIWMLTFEYEGFTRLAGLGAAVTQYCRALSRAGIEVTVLMPSHGRRASGELVAVWRGEGTGTDGRSYKYAIGAESLVLDGVRIVAFRGLDEGTSAVLDHSDIYLKATEKASLFTRAVIHWTRSQPSLPDVVHTHDWHSVLAGMAVKAEAVTRGVDLPWVHSIHLLTSPSFPWHYASESWSSLPDVRNVVLSRQGPRAITLQEAWESVGGNVDAFAALEADVVATVSYGYLEEIQRAFGFLPRVKCCVVYNPTDWSAGDVATRLSSTYGVASRRALRPVVLSSVLKEAEEVYGSLDGAKLLVVAYGRLTWQKGFDVLLRSLSHAESDLGVLILGIKMGDERYERLLRELVEAHRGRAVLCSGTLAKESVQSVVYVANAVAVPSRFEPLGMVSIESQAIGTPVVASDVPGLNETVVDLKVSASGTGLLVPPDDEVALARAITSIALLTESSDTGDRSLIDRIPMEDVRMAAKEGRALGIRERAMGWVDARFREGNTLEMLLACYRRAQEMTLVRAALSGRNER